MKISLSLVSLLVFFAVAALSHPPNPHPYSDGGEKASHVLDADGGKLRAGVNYFVLPVVRGRGGGLSPADVNRNSSSSSSCPRDVIQESSEIQTGLPVVFSPVEPDEAGSVPLSTDVNVKFFTPTVCANETVWRVGEYDELSKQYFVVTGGIEGNPGPETVTNWFKIEKVGSDYKFVFCPSVCRTCQVVCNDVGVFVGIGGTRFLALSDTPLLVMFKKTFTYPPAPLLPGPPPPTEPSSAVTMASFESLFFGFVAFLCFY